MTDQNDRAELGGVIREWLLQYADRLESYAAGLEVDTTDPEALEAHVRLLREPAAARKLAEDVAALDAQTLIAALKSDVQSHKRTAMYKVRHPGETS